MNLVKRIKGLILSPADEWDAIEAEDKSIGALYRDVILLLAAIPPLASFLGAWLFGYARSVHVLEHPSFAGGLARAGVQYLLSLPLLFVVAFVISMLAPHFDGKTSDRRALALVAYSYTPAWIAALFGLAPGLRWLDILGFYGIYLLYLGLPRMTKAPKDNTDVFTLMVLVLTIAVAALHAMIVRHIAPLQSVAM